MDRSLLKIGLPLTELNQVLPQLRWQAARLGTIGKTGLGLLVVAAIFFVAAVLPQDTTLQTLKKQAEKLQAQSQQNQNKAAIGKEISGDQALQIFYDFFPRIDSSPFWIRELLDIARKRGVEINSSEYRLVLEKDSRLARYEMILPVKGQYAQIRAFMADALQAVPAMAIAGIAIRRENVASTQLEVRLEINLYLNQ